MLSRTTVGKTPEENTDEITGGLSVKIQDVAFCVTDWSKLESVEHRGITGIAYWRTLDMGNIRVRMVEYTPGYLADHWCKRGHVLLVLEGELVTELEDGRKFTLRVGQSYQVADGAEAHRSQTEHGAKLFIVD
jgi:quercetin dioxygenase-like cupin family protein